MHNNMALYLISGPEIFGFSVKATREIGGHLWGNTDWGSIVWPAKIDPEIINPANLYTVGQDLKTGVFMVVDRLVGISETVTISDHINRSGTNYLIGKTPYKNFPRFADLGKIYSPAPDFKKITVHTVGLEQFGTVTGKPGTVWSEAIGCVAPVLHYVGIKIIALGVPKKYEQQHRDTIKSSFLNLF